MDWKKILGNLAGAAIGAASAVYGVMGAPADAAGWKAFGVAVLVAVVGNQLGLHQAPPAPAK